MIKTLNIEIFKNYLFFGLFVQNCRWRFNSQSMKMVENLKSSRVEIVLCFVCLEIFPTYTFEELLFITI